MVSTCRHYSLNMYRYYSCHYSLTATYVPVWMALGNPVMAPMRTRGCAHTLCGYYTSSLEVLSISNFAIYIFHKPTPEDT